MSKVNPDAEGRAAIVAVKPPQTRLARAERANDHCADKLLAKAPYLDDATALSQGWPIATGDIEGAFRHIQDRMDATCAR